MGLFMWSNNVSHHLCDFSSANIKAHVGVILIEALVSVIRPIQTISEKIEHKQWSTYVEPEKKRTKKKLN